MWSKKLLVGLLVVSVVSSSQLFAWFSPKAKAPLEAEYLAETTPTSEREEEQKSVSGTGVSEEQNLPSETSSGQMTIFNEQLSELEKILAENRVKESKYLDTLNEVKAQANIADAEFAELKANYESLRNDYDKAFSVAQKYKWATPFIQANILMKNVLDPVFGIEGVVGAKFGHLTTQVGAGYFLDFDNSWDKNLEVKAGIGWEF